MFNFLGKSSLIFVFFGLGFWLSMLALLAFRDHRSERQVYELEKEKRVLLRDYDCLVLERLTDQRQHRDAIRELTAEVDEAKRKHGVDFSKLEKVRVLTTGLHPNSEKVARIAEVLKS
jgi:hypothetical protein